MFQNVLKWTFKVIAGEKEKEIHILLDHDTPLEGVEQVAMQMIGHCSKVKEMQAARAAEQQSDEPSEVDELKVVE